MKTLEQTLAKYDAGTAGAGATWSAAIQNTNIDVMGRAIAAKGAALAGFQRVMTDGTYERAVQASGGTANWKSKTEAKQGNYATGVQAGKDKFASAMQKVLAAEAQILSGLPARVPGNVQANLQRSAQMALGLHARKGSLKG